MVMSRPIGARYRVEREGHARSKQQPLSKKVEYGIIGLENIATDIARPNDRIFAVTKILTHMRRLQPPIYTARGSPHAQTLPLQPVK